MNLTGLIKTVLLSGVLVLILSLCAGASYTDVMDEYKNPNGRTLIVADTKNDFTADNIKTLITDGADIIKITVTENENSVLTVFENIPLLTVVNEFPDTVFMLDSDFALSGKIYDEIKSINAENRVIFYIGHRKSEDIASFDGKCEVMTYFKGNIIFAAESYINTSVKHGVNGIALATKNPYGVVFGKSVMKKCGGRIRAMALSSTPELCGKIRQDNKVWWDDLISRGYSMILTSETAELREYLNSVQKRYTQLKEAYSEYIENYELPDFNSNLYHDYKKAYINAKNEAERLLSLKNVSENDLIKAKSACIDSKTNILISYNEFADGTAGVTVSAGRIITAVLAVAVFVWWELFVIKHIKKNRNKGD